MNPRKFSKREPIELVHLALLELRKRQLLRELVNVECQYRQLELEIELKGIPFPSAPKMSKRAVARK